MSSDGQHLDARDDGGGGQLAGEIDVSQYAIDAIAHGDIAFGRLDVDVGRAQFEGA
jgi:hypothetical protein